MTELRSGRGDVRSFGTPARWAIRRSMPAAAWATPMSDRRWRIACSCWAAPGSLLRRLSSCCSRPWRAASYCWRWTSACSLTKVSATALAMRAAFLGSSVAVAATEMRFASGSTLDLTDCDRRVAVSPSPTFSAARSSTSVVTSSWPMVESSRDSESTLIDSGDAAVMRLTIVAVAV